MKKFTVLVLVFVSFVSASRAQDLIANSAEVLVPAMMACHEYETAEVLRDYSELYQRLVAANVADNTKLIKMLIKQKDVMDDAAIEAYNHAIDTLHEQGWTRDEVLELLMSTGDETFGLIYLLRQANKQK